MGIFDFGPEVGMGYGSSVGQTAQVQEPFGVGSPEQQQHNQALRAHLQAWIQRLQKLAGTDRDGAMEILRARGNGDILAGLNDVIARYGNGTDSGALKQNSDDDRTLLQILQEQQEQMNELDRY